MVIEIITEPYFLISIVAFVIYHTVDFIKNNPYQDFDGSFPDNGNVDFLSKDQVDEDKISMFLNRYGPYNRITILHLTIMVSAGLLDAFNLNSVLGLTVLVLLKASVDIYLQDEASVVVEKA